jgi:hypothetical protein
VNYLGTEFGGRYRHPRFAIGDWNQFDRVIGGKTRANNVCESGNNGFGNLIPRAKPDLWSFLKTVRDYLRNEDMRQEQRKYGVEKGMKSGGRSRHLRNILELWDTGYYATELEYLLAVAMNLDFQHNPEEAINQGWGKSAGPEKQTLLQHN